MQHNLFEWNDNSSVISAKSISKDKINIANQLALFFEILYAGKTPRMNSDGVSSHEAVTSGSFQTISGGSMGIPKVLERTCISWILSFNTNDRFYNLSGSRVALFGSLSHSLSLYGALEAIFLGCELHHLAGLSPRSQLKYLENKKIEILYVTPTQLRLMLSAKSQSYIIDSLRYIFIGGASIKQNTLMELSELAPNAELKQFYGSSETSFITISDQFTPANSVGKAYPGVEIVLGERPDKPVSLGETGRVWVRSPFLFSKYVGDDSFNFNKFSDWVSPGELAKLDIDQNLFILGRIDRIFKIKDQAIIPEEIENYLHTKENIVDVAVVKKNDVLRGNKAVAYIATSGMVNIENLKDDCIASIPQLDGSFQIIELSTEKFPFLPSGKPDFHKLQKWDT